MDINRGDMVRKTLEREERTDKAPSLAVLVEDDDDGVNGRSAGDVGKGGRGKDDKSGGAFSVEDACDDDDAMDACNSSSCRSIRALPYEWNRLMIWSIEFTTSSPLLLLPSIPPLPVVVVPGDGDRAPRTIDISLFAGRGNTNGVNWG